MKRIQRALSLFLLRPFQHLLDFALFAAGMGLLVRFGLEFYHSATLESLEPTVWLRYATDPVLAQFRSWLGSSLPIPADAYRGLPLVLSIVAWILRSVVIASLKQARQRLEATVVKSLAAPAPRKQPSAMDMYVGLADSEQGREQLLKRYREIEQALKLAARKRCTFLSVDVVGSAKMKTGKSPTDIAASFQAYEEMLKKIFNQFGAWKQAWTPDGVMVCFLQRDLAVGAALRLLQSLQSFNATENRMGATFQVRCGVNEGEVAIYDDSKMEKVVDHVIDVAGHMQKHCDENALWLAEEVYNELADKTGFRATPHVVDGFKVYEWSLEPRSEEPAAVAAPAEKTVASVGQTVAALSPATSAIRRIGRYEILEELGRGAMGAVYKAQDPQIGRTVALKVILTRDLPPDDLAQYKERFYREARAAGKMTHSGIVTVHDIAEDASGNPYLVMEYVDGKTLEKLFSRDVGERLSNSQCLDIAIEVAEALDYAHRQNVVHRDIKPANILINAEGRAKIADFGVAKLLGTQYTQAGQVLGTPAFMSPEQLTGAPVDARSDLFSFGVVLYWMLTGERPFTGDTLTAITYKVAHTDPLPARQLNPALPPELDTLLARCLAKNCNNRYPSARQLAADLQAVKAGRPLADVQPPA